jgi:hypothetical protein
MACGGTASLITTYEHLHAQQGETSSSTEFLQPYPGVAADALLEIGTAVISVVLLLDDYLSQTNTSCVTKLLPVGVLLSYLVLRSHNRHY